MFIYSKTFENIKTIGYDFPVEDQYCVLDKEAIVADGITRDPVGVYDLDSVSEKEKLLKYPRPSGAELAAKEICDTFSKVNGLLKDKLTKCNESVNALNKKYIKKCDYLQNDYYGTVASCVHIEDDILDYAYICDCGVVVYDELGNIKFQTEDDKELYSDNYINKLGIPWNLPESRVTVRKEFRNNLNNIVEGKCVSYGALTGEESAVKFIRSGRIKLSKGDTVLTYSDGFTNFLHDEEFIKRIVNFEKEEFEMFVKDKSLTDYDKFGKEKTIVIFKN